MIGKIIYSKININNTTLSYSNKLGTACQFLQVSNTLHLPSRHSSPAPTPNTHTLRRQPHTYHTDIRSNFGYMSRMPMSSAR